MSVRRSHSGAATAPLIAIAICSLALLVAAPPAGASRGLATGFADSLYKGKDRAAWLHRTKVAKAKVVRIDLHWSDVAPRKPRRPRNPGDPAYRFGSIDAAVRSARAHGLRVLLTVFSAPSWAEGKHPPKRAPKGTWKPRAKPFGDFAHALARRYSGHYGTLPRVSDFEAWNEPNLSVYLTPQWRHRRAKSPRIYRRLLNAFYGGIKSVAPGDTVISGGTAPFGDPPGGERMRPVRFVRGLLCLHGHGNLHRTRCHTKAHMDALAHHPIDRIRGPDHHALSRADVTVPDLPRLNRVLRAARRHHTVRPSGRIPLWVTEFWWETDPPDKRLGIPAHKEAHWVEKALYLFWKAGARTAINLQIRDAPLVSSSSYQTGIYYVDGKKKPSYRSFRFPFVTHRKSKKVVGAWGKSPQSGKLAIQVKRHGRWRTKNTLKAHSGKVFTTTFRLRGKARVRAKLKHSKSLTWHQG